MFRKILKNTFLLINLIFALLLVLSVVSCYVSPAKAWIFAFFGLLYPIFLLVNFFFVIFWGIQRKVWVWISVVLILMSWHQLHAYYQLSLFKTKKANQGKQVSLTTYNVRAFNQYNWAHNKSAREQILNFLVGKNTDVICMQEIFTSNTDGFNTKRLIKRFNKYHSHFIHFTAQTKKSNYGIATFSKYPIVNSGVIRFRKSNNVSIFTDVVIDADTIRIYNNHLQSIHLLKSHYDLFDTISAVSKDKGVPQLLNISDRFIDAYRKRALQAEMVADHIKKSPYKVIVCGDFNDTPTSYTYHHIRGNLRDAFIQSGSGFGNTYFGIFPSFRIDYIFHHKALRSYNLRIFQLPFSDHFPMQCGFTWK